MVEWNDDLTVCRGKSDITKSEFEKQAETLHIEYCGERLPLNTKITEESGEWVMVIRI